MNRFAMGSVDAEIGLPLRMGNTSRRTPSPSARAASRISSARRHSGTRCSRFAFIRAAEIVDTRPAVSISSHVASRTSPDRAAVSTRNSNASLTAGCADLDARTVSTAAATSLWGSACICFTMSFCGPSTLTCQIGVRITSALLTSETGRRPMRGNA